MLFPTGVSLPEFLPSLLKWESIGWGKLNEECRKRINPRFFSQLFDWSGVNSALIFFK